MPWWHINAYFVKCIILKHLFLYFFKVDEDYGVDWDGPPAMEDANSISIPDVQLPRSLTAEEIAGLPNRDVPLNATVNVYNSTVEQLTEILRY